MTSTSETGHAKNVANFEDLVSFCTAYGTAYNPSNDHLLIPQLQTLHHDAKIMLQTVKTNKTAFDNACNAREIAFAPLKKLCTRIVNALESINATQQTIDDAITINHKIQGKRSNNSKKDTDTEVPPTEDTTPEGNKISVSQQGYDSLIDNFSKLIVLVSGEPLYIPNESDLNVAALNARFTNLETLNTVAIDRTTAYSNALIARNTLLYKPALGLVDIALSVKKYVKSVFGASNSQYKQISGIKFKKTKI
ncbi:MAG: hypothetical protein HXX18_01615 [Bacteroidetes bacterium]|nr:hypothetical protein [Bacteroidota bacterium]